MDATTRRLIDCALGARYGALPDTITHECKRRVVDTLACAIGAYDDPLSVKARAFAQRYSGVPEARVWGCQWQTSMEAASFANGVMLRLLDINDMYRVKSGGHPSDVIAGIWAVGESLNSDGQSMIGAITLAYDVYCSFCDAIDINSSGWDQPVYGALACALGAGRLLGLTSQQLADAISLSIVPNMAMHRTRRGELSNWKGCAGANGSRNGIFAALLAASGFAGPSEAIEGKSGLWDIVGKFDWDIPATPELPFCIAQTHLKNFPICYHVQTAAWIALDMRPQLHISEIQEINAEVYKEAVTFVGSDPCCWAPKTSSTADHSLPYVVATALLEGKVTAQSFAMNRLEDPSILSLMSKIRVSEDPMFSKQYPRSAPSRIRIRLADGRELVNEQKSPKGQADNPMSDAEINAKFQTMFETYGKPDQCRQVLDRLWNLEKSLNINDVSALLVGRASDRQVSVA